MYIFCQVQWQDHDWAKRTYNTKFYANQEQELKQIIKKLRFFSAVQHPGDLVLTKSFFLKANLLPIMSFFRKEVRNAKCEFLQNYNDKIKSWEDKENVKLFTETNLAKNLSAKNIGNVAAFWVMFFVYTVPSG